MIVFNYIKIIKILLFGLNRLLLLELLCRLLQFKLRLKWGFRKTASEIRLCLQRFMIIFVGVRVRCVGVRAFCWRRKY